MSTELVAIERINIKKDNGDADALRSCLVHYLQQFLDSASIESMTLHELTIICSECLRQDWRRGSFRSG